MNTAYALSWPSWVTDTTGGTSSYAVFVRKQTGDALKVLCDTLSLSDGRGSVLEELAVLAESCAQPGWDGYGGESVSRGTLCNARAFVEALPQGAPMPTVGAEPDGHLTLEWYRNPNWVLSVSISPENNLYYAAILGCAKTHGEEPFLGRIPGSLLQIMERLRLK
jgi:hypothetical protein